MIACLFDIDGTLLASGGAGKAALESSLTEEFAVNLVANIPYSGRTDRAIARDLLGAHGIEVNDANWEKLLSGYLKRLPDRLQRFQGRVLPGIAGILSRLRQQPNIAVGLLTGNVRAGARVKLGHFGLYDHFAFGGFGDHHFDRDDVAREALAAVHRHTGQPLPGDAIWVIGDTPLDVQCARAIGAKVLAVATGVHSHEELVDAQPDLVMRDLSQPESWYAALGL